MCSICKPILRNLALKHEPNECPFKKSLWCEFCATTGHTPNLCPDRTRREAQFLRTSLESNYCHPESKNLYKKPTIYMPQTERGIRAMLKGFGGSYATDPAVTKERLHKKLRSLNYEILTLSQNEDEKGSQT
jgi:hypothetical protein